jgi:probable F420-dependent oxidoreductase
MALRLSGAPVGVSLPVQEELRVADYVALARLAEDRGFHTLFVGEIAGVEAFAMLGILAASTVRIRLASGVVSIYNRSPALTAMGFATVSSLAPGRVVAGLGTGSYTVVEDWHGRELRAPRQTMREFIEIFRAVLAGERVTRAGEELRISGFRLQLPREGAVPVLMGSFNPRMLRLAGAIADGVVLAFCPPDGLPERIAEVRRGAEEAGRDPDALEIAAYVNAYAGPDVDLAMERFRRLVLQYAVQPTHRVGFLASFPRIDEATELWNQGRRQEALALVGDETVLDLCPVGDAETVVRHLERVRAAGVTLPVLFPQSLRMGDAETPAATIAAVASALERQVGVATKE